MQINIIPIKSLKPHPRNDYFFDDITGDAWQDFLLSVKTSGVIEPIVVSNNNVIISGHQRVRACKELNIEEIKADVCTYENEDQMLKDLIETNLRQRGIGNPNPVKFGRCIKELERIYGIREGSANEKGTNRIGVSNNFTDQSDTPTTESDLATQLGLTRQSLQNYKKLADMIPELQDLIETGKVTATTARAIVKKLTEEEQKKLVDQLSENDGKVSSREIDFYIDRVKTLSDEKDKLTKEKESLEEQLYRPITIEDLTAEEIDNLKKEFANSPITTINKEEVDTEKVNELQETIKNLRSQLSQAQKDYDLIKEQNETLKDDNNHIRLSMNESTAKVYTNCKALDYMSRIDRVVKDELSNIELYGDIENLDEVVISRLDEVANDLICRLNDFRRRLYTVDVMEIIDVE